MEKPLLSSHFESRQPSAIRLAQLKFNKRKTIPESVVNVAIGNVSLPTNPAMQKRMFALNDSGSPFAKGIVRYTGTEGTKECQEAFRNILKCEGFNMDKACIQITDGGSAAMELLVVGLCGPTINGEKTILLIDPAYTNYISFVERIGRKMITVKRNLSEDGNFDLPELNKIEDIILKNNPGALIVIPYDNPTGQFYDYNIMENLAKLCVKYNLWMVSDEAYRELYYENDKKLVSIWGITDNEVPGIEGRRISVETASKVWNACGLRIGAIITDNADFYNRSVAEYTANLCPNAIGQYIFGALAYENKKQIAKWCKQIREYYKEQIHIVYQGLKEKEPELIVSSPDAAIYSVIDVRNVVKTGFDSNDFVLYCAEEGAVKLDGVETTLLIAPMKGFYDVEEGERDPGDTQFRIAFVETPEKMAQIPELFVKLLHQYEMKRERE